MAVHVPLSVEAQMEARVLMMSTNNILSPGQRHARSSTPPRTSCSACYYLTRERPNAAGRGHDVLRSRARSALAFDAGEVDLHPRAHQGAHGTAKTGRDHRRTGVHLQRDRAARRSLRVHQQAP
ncbi:MAG: hypothetical protein MZU95_15165 [Desulfomicrobium escambiense]|nr:hypothetical protein [Desulfomicrobium escambiense]